MKKRTTGNAFSLIEVLFAVFLIALCAIVVSASMPLANKARMRADQYNKALGLAQKQLEAIRGKGYANATASQLLSLGLIDSTTTVATNTYAFTNTDSAALDNPARILPSGTGTVLVEQADLDLRRVVVTVNWIDRGTTRQVQLGTLVANL